MIEEGTKVLLSEDGVRKFLITAKREMTQVGGLGVVDGTAICNSSFGQSMKIGSREFVILKPSVKDLLSLIERRAQIVLPKDSFLVPLHLNLSSGSRVVEGGVGSGALTIVLLNAVGAEGRVFSYETKADFADIARRNVAMSENASAWELRLEDVCKATLPEKVDAAMLDIPNPWDALENITGALRPGGYVGLYVPNANQLEAGVRKMRGLDLGEVVSFETLQREMVVHDGGVRPSFDMLGHTGYLAFGRKLRA